MSVLPPLPPRPPGQPSQPSQPGQDPQAQEQAQQDLARRSPLAMRFEVVGCMYASMQWDENKAIPNYSFHPPCPFGKSIPDQDCRDCAHVRFHPIGHEQHIALHRYHRHGMVVPLTEEDADAVMDVVAARGSGALRRPQWVAYHQKLEAEAEARRKDEERARELERRQVGQSAQLRVEERR